VYVAGEDPDDLRVAGHDLGESVCVPQTHLVQERDADWRRRVMQGEDGGAVPSRLEHIVEPRQLLLAKPPRHVVRAGAVVEGVEDNKRGVAVHNVPAPVAEVRAAAEDGFKRGTVVVVARCQVDWERIPLEQSGELRVTFRIAEVGEVASDDHTVRARIQRQDTGESEMQAMRGG
jgi:hypothetical protein